MSYDTKDLRDLNVNSRLQNLHDVVHNVNKHRLWWKIALIVSLGFIGLSFIFIWVLYATNENRTEEFDYLIYACSGVMLTSLIILGVLFFFKAGRESQDFGDKLVSYINELKQRLAEERIVSDTKIQFAQKQKAQYARGLDILGQNSANAALGEASRQMN
jgi:Tfp pilus assembly protein PilN